MSDNSDESRNEEPRQSWPNLRTTEWAHFPLFVAQPIVPAALFFARIATIVVPLVILDVLWTLTLGRRLAAPPVSRFASYFVMLRWLSSPACAAALWYAGKPLEGIVALLWPMFTLVLLFFCLAFTPGIGDMNTRILQWFRRGANETNSELQRSGRE